MRAVAAALGAIPAAASAGPAGAQGPRQHAAATTEAPAVRLVEFRPERRPLRPGDTAWSALVLRNEARAPATVWVGYSLQDPAGAWHDVDADRVTLAAGRAAATRMGWRVPDEAAAGSWRAVMAAWSAPPGSPGALRLASADRRDAFRVRGPDTLLADEPRGPWRAAAHALGRGRLRPEQVLRHGTRGFRLRLAPGACDGAEVRSAARHHFGEFTARLRTPDAPGSLSAFFLFGDVPGGGDDEIDIELFNDGSRRALLTAWVRGKETRQAEVVLPFDPAAGFHDYTIRWTARALELVADGRTLARWTDGYPRQRAMHVMANVWWPRWLECRPLAEPREMVIEEIAYR